jgi:iron(II)-dependent oxidoreductase
VLTATPSRIPTVTPDSKPAATPATSEPLIEHSITKDSKTASGLYVQDIDGDGDNDIVGGGSSEILWWQNTLIEPEPQLALTEADCSAAGLPETACTGVNTNDEWTPVIREVNGIEMVLVPAGCFVMGNEGGLPEEQPVHQICFDEPFWIDRTEVTVAQFAQFLNGQKAPVNSHAKWLDPGNSIFPAANQLKMQDGEWKPYARHDNNPLESVRWVGADEYCDWRSARLPTEAEWEFAARGPDSLLYPWGDKFIRDNVVRWISRIIVPEVGSKPQGASWVGALDMSSSLFEWVSSLYQSYPYFAADGREVSLDIDETSDRVFRGSAWYHPDGMHDNVSTTARFNGPPEHAAWYFGFRCAQSINPEENADGKMLSTKPTITTTFSANDCLAAGLPANACTGVFSNDEWTPVIREFNDGDGR